MENEFDGLVANLMSASNADRQSAERMMTDKRKGNGQELLQSLTQYIITNGADADATKQQHASFAAILLKKQYLDDRAEEDGCWQLETAQVEELCRTISQSIDFKVQSHSLLNRKADIICKCFKKMEKYDEMIQNLVTILKDNEGTPEEKVKRKRFAMYNFEILSEYHLSQEHIVQHSGDFLQLFTETLQDNDTQVKVASLRAITSFLSSIDDEEVVLKYKGMMGDLLDVVIAVLQQDETQGQDSLASMIELTASHGDVWGGCMAKLIFVVSEIMKNREFEDATR